jgi:UDP-N-acetylmuramate dehydrogenase
MIRKFQENVSLSAFTNYKIGGPARFFFEAKNETDVYWALGEAKSRKIPIFVLGGGTNLLMPDKGFRGLVLKITINRVIATQNIIAAGAGTSMANLTNFSAKHSLAGLDWAGGLPGSLGGAIRGNAGCFGGEMKDSITAVQSIDMKTLRIIRRNAVQCHFGYRTSIFKQRPGEIILSAELRMKKGSSRKIASSLREKKAWRKSHHPLEYPSAGSVFKNVPLVDIFSARSKEYRAALKDLKVTYRGSSFSVKTDPVPVIAAAKLIGECGLAGLRHGGAEISTKHTNFIVNARGATARDILFLIARAKKKVLSKFGVQLEEEIQIVA